MAAQAAAELATDIAAHHVVILAANERGEAILALAMLSAKARGCSPRLRQRRLAGSADGGWNTA